MTKSINIKLSQIKFPPACVVCMSPATDQYTTQQMINYGRRSYTVRVNVPMCNKHAGAAKYKGLAERWVNTLAVIGGIFGGIIAGILLFLRWEGEVNIIVKLFGGGLFGFGIFIIIWWFAIASIAPLFATAESKEARNAVRIGMYWPKEEMARLDFANEQYPDLMHWGN